jgi:hypothetical protein
VVGIQIPAQTIIPTEVVLQDAAYKGLRLVRYQTNESDRNNYHANRYQFQHEPADYTVLKAVLCRKGAEGKYRLVATIHPGLKLFTDLVRYDPANPPFDDYDAQGMIQAHERTQSDFKGQKAQNRVDFAHYILEGVRSNRTLYLPVIAGWQSTKVFDKTVFVAFDESDPNAMYGEIYLPKAPIMQADGQTQTAALFHVAKSADAREALNTLQVTLEIELGVTERDAAQSFADRNGRGTKKDRNLVISYDTSSALSELRAREIEGTVFEGRLADGRSHTGEPDTQFIVDLSTMEQVLINVISGGSRKPEHFKHHHLDYFLPFASDFPKLLDNLFASKWPKEVGDNDDPFRRIYVHGWPFVLKALALAYHQARLDEMGPLSAAINSESSDDDAAKSLAEKYRAQVAKNRQTHSYEPKISYEELRRRLGEIDWVRYRKHWVSIAGAPIARDGRKKVSVLRSTPAKKVLARAQNTPAVIAAVTAKILSESWSELRESVDEPVDGAPIRAKKTPARKRGVTPRRRTRAR